MKRQCFNFIGNFRNNGKEVKKNVHVFKLKMIIIWYHKNYIIYGYIGSITDDGTVTTTNNNNYINNLRDKFSPEPGFETGSPAQLIVWVAQSLERQRVELETRVRILVQARMFLLIINIRPTKWLFRKLNFHQNLPICVVNIKSPD